MAQYTDQQAEDLLPPFNQKANTLSFFRWILSIFQYFFNYTNAEIKIKNQVLSGQVGVLQDFCLKKIGVAVEVKDNFANYYPYRSPYDAQIVISESATLEQYNAVVELFTFYKMAGRVLVFKYGTPVVIDNTNPYTYFELGLNTANPNSYSYFELGI